MQPRRFRDIGAAIVATVLAAIALGRFVDAQTAPRPHLRVSLYPTLSSTVLPADVNNDSRVDLIAGRLEGFTNVVVVRLGNGDGTFSPERIIAGGLSPVAVGDFNGDHSVDVLARGSALSILPGAETAPSVMPSQPSPTSLPIGSPARWRQTSTTTTRWMSR